MSPSRSRSTFSRQLSGTCTATSIVTHDFGCVTVTIRVMLQGAGQPLYSMLGAHVIGSHECLHFRSRRLQHRCSQHGSSMTSTWLAGGSMVMGTGDGADSIICTGRVDSCRFGLPACASDCTNKPITPSVQAIASARVVPLVCMIVSRI